MVLVLNKIFTVGKCMGGAEILTRMEPGKVLLESTKASDALPDSQADVPIFGQSLLTVPNWTHAVTYRDRTAPLGLALCSPDSLRSRELAKYKIQYL